jgi:hypothetical protein
MQPPYSTIAFIETLRPEKRGLVTYLIDAPTDRTYGYIIELGPITIFKITGWHGERFTGFKFFKHVGVPRGSGRHPNRLRSDALHLATVERVAGLRKYRTFADGLPPRAPLTRQT